LTAAKVAFGEKCPVKQGSRSTLREPRLNEVLKVAVCRGSVLRWAHDHW
jgi:hypothetical protein